MLLIAVFLLLCYLFYVYGTRICEDFKAAEKNHDMEKGKSTNSSARKPSSIDCPVLGRRGLIDFEVEIICAKQDLHSGSYGGSVPEAVSDLCWLLNQLTDWKGNILVPNIDEDLVKQSTTEIDMKSDGAETCWKPSLSFHGIEGAFDGAGAKTVIPAKVIGKFSIRTGTGQKTGHIAGMVDRFLRTTIKSRNTPNKLKTKYTHIKDVTKP